MCVCVCVPVWQPVRLPPRPFTSLHASPCELIAFTREPGLAFTSNGKFMALLERHEGKDHVVIIACETWQVAVRFETDTQDATDLQWSPDDHHLCVWDSPLTYTVCVCVCECVCVRAHACLFWESDVGAGERERAAPSPWT